MAEVRYSNLVDMNIFSGSFFLLTLDLNFHERQSTASLSSINKHLCVSASY